MRVTIILLALVLMSACSSYKYSEEQSIHFKSNHSSEGFFLFVPNILESNGFAIAASNPETGMIRAHKIISEKDANLDLIIAINDTTRDVKIKIINRIKLDKEVIIEYYTLEEYNPEFKEYFYSAVENIKSNSTKTAFPNN